MSVNFTNSLGGEAAASAYGAYGNKGAIAKKTGETSRAVTEQGVPALKDYIDSKLHKEKAPMGQQDATPEDLPAKSSLVLPQRGTVR